MRLVVKTYKYKLYNSKKNRYLVRQIELASEIWNFCIAMRRMYYLVYGKTLKANDLKKYIAKICKRRKWAHWHNLGSQATTARARCSLMQQRIPRLPPDAFTTQTEIQTIGVAFGWLLSFCLSLSCGILEKRSVKYEYRRTRSGCS